MTEDTRPVLLVIGTGMRYYREYLLASIAPQYRVHLFAGAEPTWEREYIDGWTVLRDTLDAAVMIPAAQALPRVDGVLCWDEARILPTSQVAAALGLPGGDPAMVLRCRDKHLTRQALAAAGVPQPQSVLVADEQQALAAAERIGYPVVLKPRALAASLGVVLAADAFDVRRHFAFARDTTVPEAPHYDTNVLVEECVTGAEISVDSAVHGGEVFPMFAARKQVDYAPYFEETGHVVDAADPLLSDPQILALLADTHAALGFTDGMTHTEIMLTGRGPKIIEVNARIGGDMIPYLGLRSSGADPGLAAAAVACGRRPVVTYDRKQVGAVRFCYVDADDLRIDAIEAVTEGLPAAVDRVQPLAAAGAVVSPPPKGTVWGRIAYLTAFADTEAECRAALDAAQAALVVRTSPAPPAADGAAAPAGAAG
jgi:biotin carboxylase